jgi:hypothetical protein
MSTLWIAAILVAAAQGDASPKPDTAKSPPAVSEAAEAPVAEATVAEKKKPQVVLRSGRELKKATEEALRRWARCEDKKAAAAAREFLVLYRELQRDDKLGRATRNRLYSKVRYRLLALAPQIAKRAAIDKRLAKQKAARSQATTATTDQSADKPTTGGARGGGAVGNDDHGEQLVELIHATIFPHTWDVNGGLGSMYYWRNGRALVVRQSQEGHEQLEHLLIQPCFAVLIKWVMEH